MGSCQREIHEKEKVRAWVAVEDTDRLGEWGVLKLGEGLACVYPGDLDRQAEYQHGKFK